jgi:hypothetical protein
VKEKPRVIDARYLTDDETVEYRRIEKAPLQAWPATLICLWFVLGVITFLTLFNVALHFHDVGNDLGEFLASVPALAVVFLGPVALWGHCANQVVEARQASSDEFAKRIRYDRRVREGWRSTGGFDAPNPYWLTGGYDPKRYYSYDKSERDYMRRTGMGPDVFDSNVREHDPSWAD